MLYLIANPNHIRKEQKKPNISHFERNSSDIII